jgi:hypothetical protein
MAGVAEQGGDLLDETVGGTVGQTDGHDDRTLPLAQTDHPAPLGQAAPGTAEPKSVIHPLS